MPDLALFACYFSTRVPEMKFILLILSLGLGLSFAAVGLAQDPAQPTAPKFAQPAQRTLDDYFPFTPPGSQQEWQSRRSALREHLLVSLGLWPLPQRTPLNPVVHGAIDCGDYTIEKVYFESLPGFFVTGNIYRPKNATGPLPAVLCPHGHWRNGRFLWSTEDEIKRELESGAEKFAGNARSVLQSRCASLARLGCLVFHYDMIGYADSQQISYDLAHGFKDRRPEMEDPNRWGLFSPAAELRLQSVMGLQTWNSIRALDFLETLPEVDRGRIGVTGASGGGTQSFILCALDDRPAVAFPAVMVSTAMQGGCTCENCCQLRVNSGNVEFAAMFAPKPLGLTAANDWTREMEQKGFPELKQLYELLGAGDKLQLTARLEFGHNYNQVSREAMYGWFNQHLQLNAANLEEREINPLPPEQLTVFDAEHARPAGGADFEVQLLSHWDADSRGQLDWNAAATAPDQARLTAQLKTAFRVLLSPPPGDSELEWENIEQLEEKTRRRGWLKPTPKSFETPVIRLAPNRPADQAAKRLAIVLDAQGQTTLDRDPPDPSPLAAQLLKRGVDVVQIDLLHQGNLKDAANPEGQNRLVPNGRRAAAYTFGYNQSLLAQRATQIIQLVRALRREAPDLQLTLVAAKEFAPLATFAAANLSTAELNELAIELDDFRWETIRELEHPAFLPGVVKYGGIAGCLAAEPQRRVLVLQRPGSVDLSTAAKAASLAGGADRLSLTPISAEEPIEERIATWLAPQ
jgi:dienelactone hydrolase